MCIILVIIQQKGGHMEERKKRLFIWSVILGFCGWLGWELSNEKGKAEKQIEEAEFRKSVQRKYRQ
jgi:predicted negative regulator of RcsB-dependent stress response